MPTTQTADPTFPSAALGAQGTVMARDGTTQVLAGPRANGGLAVALFNRGDAGATISTTAAAVGFLGGSGCAYKGKEVSHRRR